MRQSMIPYLNERHIVSRVNIEKVIFDHPDRESGFIPEYNDLASSQNSVKVKSNVQKNVRAKAQTSRVKQVTNLFGQRRDQKRKRKASGVRLIEGKSARSNAILTRAEIERKKV